jgi:hypothetical protein
LEQEFLDIYNTLLYKRVYDGALNNGGRKLKDEKPFKKCLKNGCVVLTNHNGGYCSAICCKEDRKR